MSLATSPADRAGDGRGFTAGRAHIVLACTCGVGAASVVAVAGVVVFAGDIPLSAARFAIAAALVWLGLVSRIPVGGRADLPRVNWAELGLLAAFVLVPVAWVALAVAVGALGAYAPSVLGRGRIERARAAFGICRAVVGAGLAVAIALTMGVGLRARGPADLGHLAQLPVLVLAAAGYYLVSSLLAAAWIAGDEAGSVVVVWWRWVWTGAPVLATSLLLGVAGVVVLSVNAWWLAVLAPVFWALHRSYLSRASLALDRRIWAELADATRALHEIDDRGVRLAALRGATRIFSPDQVELVLHHAADQPVVLRAPDGPAVAGTVIARQLLVAGESLGELRLRYRRGVQLSAPAHDALFAYGDAVASALHDATTHRQLQAMTARSAYEAVHDPLTGLSNRFTLLARGNAMLVRLDSGQLVALVLLDVDGFRRINDAISHAAGDEVLRMLAGRLASIQEGSELLGGLGADEFALLITDLSPDPDGGCRSAIEQVTERARAIGAVLSEPADIAGVSLRTEVSAGVVVQPVGGVDMIELLRRANVALRQARREGARVAVYDPGIDPDSSQRLALLADLRDALATTDQLVLYLRPVVDLGTSRPIGVQAQIYWRHPHQGLLAPEAFLTAIEHSDMGRGFTQYTVDLALAAAARLASAGSDLPVSVRLCARCAVDPELLDLVAARLVGHGVAPDRLIISISGAVMETELATVRDVITRLRATGVRISVDDFGTASASLSFLTEITVDEVKIDATIVAELGKSPQTTAIICATVDLAQRLGLRVVAEGVTRAEQREALAALAVTAAQGPLLGQALPAADAIARLTKSALATPIAG